MFRRYIIKVPTRAIEEINRPRIRNYGRYSLYNRRILYIMYCWRFRSHNAYALVQRIQNDNACCTFQNPFLFSFTTSYFPSINSNRYVITLCINKIQLTIISKLNLKKKLASVKSLKDSVPCTYIKQPIVKSIWKNPTLRGIFYPPMFKILQNLCTPFYLYRLCHNNDNQYKE